MNLDGSVSIPLWLLYEDEIETLARAQTAQVANWLGSKIQGRETSRGAAAGLRRRLRAARSPAWAGAGRALAVARGGTSRAAAAAPLSAGAGLQRRRGDADCVWGSPTGRIASSAIARQERALATLEPPANADHAFVALAGRGAAHGARLDQHAGRSDLGSRGTRRRGTRARRASSAQYREWVGEELLAANFPRFTRSAARAPRRRGCRSCAGRRAAAASDCRASTLVGKGVCFDSGGLDIKPSSGMALMKKDMGGAAVALALAHMLMSRGSRAELHVLMPAVENSDRRQCVPARRCARHAQGLDGRGGQHRCGRAAGAVRRAGAGRCRAPDLIIDFATLTGRRARRVGSGVAGAVRQRRCACVRISRASPPRNTTRCGPCRSGWAMTRSSAARSRISTTSPLRGSPGAIFGALFLKRFVTAGAQWMHIDLYAWNPRDRPGRGVGAEAQAVRGAYSYLLERYGTV